MRIGSMTFISGPSGGFVNIADYFNVGLNQATGLLNWSVLTLGLAVRCVTQFTGNNFSPA